MGTTGPPYMEPIPPLKKKLPEPETLEPLVAQQPYCNKGTLLGG